MRKLFGTDGIRGVANAYPMTPEMVVKIGKAIAHVFSEKEDRKVKIVIGKDTRLSGYMIENALTSGIVSAGCDVLLVGPLPTPAVAHLTKSLNCDVGIMLTASHNPAKDNGIKIFASDGYKLPDEIELKIEKCVFNDECDNDDIHGEKIGKAFRIDDAKGRYIEYVKSAIDNHSLKGLKIVVDCANGAMYATAPTIFRELGANVTVFNDKPDGLNINQECGALHAEELGSKVKELKADVGVAFDGDGDRFICCDEKGEIIDGDAVLCLLALELLKKKELSKNTLVVTEYSNLAVEDTLMPEGIDVVRTDNGDRYVIQEMRKNGYSLGGEKSGHIIFGDYSTTGDGLIAALHMLCMINGKKLSEVTSFFKPYPQVLVNFKVKEKKPLEEMEEVVKKIKDVEDKLGSDGRTLVRYSGTEKICRVMIEGKDQKEITELADEIKKVILEALK